MPQTGRRHQGAFLELTDIEGKLSADEVANTAVFFMMETNGPSTGHVRLRLGIPAGLLANAEFSEDMQAAVDDAREYAERYMRGEIG